MVTVRLDTIAEATLKRLARQRGQTKSEIVRDAIAHLADEGTAHSAPDRLRPHIGVVDSGDLNLSRNTGQRFLEILKEKCLAGGPR